MDKKCEYSLDGVTLKGEFESTYLHGTAKETGSEIFVVACMEHFSYHLCLQPLFFLAQFALQSLNTQKSCISVSLTGVDGRTWNRRGNIFRNNPGCMRTMGQINKQHWILNQDTQAAPTINNVSEFLLLSEIHLRYIELQCYSRCM